MTEQAERRALPLTSGIYEKPQRPPTPKDPKASMDGSGMVPPSDAAHMNSSEQKPKEDFPDPFKVHDEMVRNISRPKEKDQSDKDVESINNAGMSASESQENEDFMKISKEDLELAEQLIFNGYAECQIEIANFPGRKFTICSTNGEELNMIDEMAFDKIKSVKQNTDGTIDLPDSALKSLRNALFISLSYRGVDGKDIAQEPIIQLNTLKKAILKLGDLYNSGDLTNAESLKASIKKALLKRSTIVKRMSAPLIDFLSDEKYKFDVKMLNIMSEKKMLPKS
jgi:hypothetical protein